MYFARNVHICYSIHFQCASSENRTYLKQKNYTQKKREILLTEAKITEWRRNIDTTMREQ